LDSTLDAATRQHANALITVEDPLTFAHRKLIADFAAKNSSSWSISRPPRPLGLDVPWFLQQRADEVLAYTAALLR
jgi:hypothetical protein